MRCNEGNPDSLGNTLDAFWSDFQMENALEFIKHNAVTAPVYCMGRVDWDLLQVSHTEQWNFCFPLPMCFFSIKKARKKKGQNIF